MKIVLPLVFVFNLLAFGSVANASGDGASCVGKEAAVSGGKLKPTQKKYQRPLYAENGSVWPYAAGYVVGYKKLKANGYSRLTVDNTRNASDVYVKMFSLDGALDCPVRIFYIPAYSQFTVEKVTAGNYDIRYRDLASGALARSESFELEEIKTREGIEYSDITMTLYTVSRGNMQTYGLSEEGF